MPQPRRPRIPDNLLRCTVLIGGVRCPARATIEGRCPRHSRPDDVPLVVA